MKITIDPNWTFIEALEAAWAAYSGGRQYGVPNRTRVLEQWANVVGRERAVYELETTLGEYETLEEASEHLGLSLYTIRKLRSSFNNMPTITPIFLEPANLYELLKTLPSIKLSNELSIIVDVVPRFAAFLGYSQAEMYFEPSISRTLRPGTPRLHPDVILAPRGVNDPHIIIEVKRFTHDDKLAWESAKAQLTEYLSVSGAIIGVILSPKTLGIQRGDKFHNYSL